MRVIRHLLLPAGLTVTAALGVLYTSWLHGVMRPAFGDVAARGAGAILAATAWLAAAWLVSRIVDVLLIRPGRARIPRLLVDLLRAVLFGLAILAILGAVLDQPVVGVVATSGVLIAILGFALRNMIADVFSGIALNVEHPYRAGDWIEVAPGRIGRIDEINWRATRLLTLEGTVMIVPNGVAAGSRLVNFSQPAPLFRSAVSVTLDHDLPVARAKRALLAAALCADGVLAEPRPDVLAEAVTTDGVVYQVRFWVADYGRLAAGRDSVLSAILDHLDRIGAEPSRAKHDVRGRHRSGDPTDAAVNRRLLDHVDLFTAFQPEELDRLVAAMRRHTVPAGSAAVRQDEEGRSLFLIAEGILDVGVARDGGMLHLDRLRPGDVFGEMSLLTGQPRSASVVAVTEAVIHELDKADLDPVLRRRPELAARLADLMADRQRRNDERRQAEDNRAPVPPHTSSQDLLARVRAFFGLGAVAQSEPAPFHTGERNH